MQHLTKIVLCDFTIICTQCWVNYIAIRTTDETGGFQDLLLPLLLTSQVSEGVDDDTKNKVEDNDDDDEEEQKVVNHSGRKERLLCGPVTGKIYRTCL